MIQYHSLVCQPSTRNINTGPFTMGPFNTGQPVLPPDWRNNTFNTGQPVAQGPFPAIGQYNIGLE